MCSYFLEYSSVLRQLVLLTVLIDYFSLLQSSTVTMVTTSAGHNDSSA